MDISTTELLSIYTETLFVDNFLLQLPESKGSFEKEILIFLNIKDNEEDSQKLLTNMMSACKIEEKDCYIFFIEKEEQTLQLINKYKPKIILSFGVYIANDIYKFPPKINKLQLLDNAQTIIAMPLHKIINNAEAKKELWVGLQQIFNK